MSPEFSSVDQEAQSQLFIDEYGLEDIADLRIEAHGGMYSVSEAIAECPPFAAMLQGMAATLADMPERTEILKNTVRTMAAGTAEVSVEPKKKLK